jgi:DNA-binding NarL/FixJ family response regulator
MVLEPPSALSLLRVVIADDHVSYREGLAHALRRSGIEVTDAVPTAEHAIRVVEQTAANVAILDLQLAGLSGLEAIRSLRRASPASPVLVIGVLAPEADIVDAITAGASGYLEKDRPVEEIIGWIRAVAAGKQESRRVRGEEPDGAV